MEINENTQAVNIGKMAEGNIPKKKAVQRTGKPEWKTVLIGGVPAVMLGTAGVILANNVSIDTQNHETGEPDAVPDEVLQQTLDKVAVPVAVGINDEMSFSEAFSAARDEVGAGGVFVWHGNTFNTYLKEEWDNLPEEEQESLFEEQEGLVEEPVDSFDDEPVVLEVESVPFAEVDAEPIAEAEVEVENEPEQEPEVEIEVDESPVENFDEEPTPDIQADPEDVIDTRAEEVDTGGDNLYSDMPDYTNDADVSSF